MSKFNDRLHFNCIVRCALCRKRLPKPSYEEGFVPRPSIAWEYNILGLCDIADPNKQPRIITIPGDLADAYTFKNLSVTFKSGRLLTINFCLEPSCEEEKVAYLVHLDCWKLINVLNSNPTTLSIYEFAQSTHSIFEFDHIAETEDLKTTDFTDAFEGSNLETGLRSLLGRLSRLPVEIQLTISAYCALNLLSSLLKVVNTSSNLLKAFKDGLGKRTIELVSTVAINTLYTETISIFGYRIISHLGFNDPRGISVKTKTKGIKFAIGPYGLQALKILYTDDTSSSWLGDPTNGWIGVMHGSDLRGHQIPPNRFYQGRENTGNNAPGMMAHGKSSKTIGDCQWRPIHLYLQPNERIESVWLRISVDHLNQERDPTILITTNFNRTCVFGPSLTPSIIRNFHYSWTRLSKNLRSNPIGIFYDAISVRRNGAKFLTNIGITEDSQLEVSARTQHLPRIPVLEQVPPIHGTIITSGYLSIGNLGQVERLMVRKVGPRFTGMSVHHEDGRIAVFGQWDCSQISSISEIYNRRNGVLTSIAFSFFGDVNASYVDNVFVGLDYADPLEMPCFSHQLKVFPVTNLNQVCPYHSAVVPVGLICSHPTIMWWTTRLYDHIELWIGAYQEINVSTHSYNTVDLI
ncbi:hypothetical protein B7463_g6401, partial [Scytalidium lignicola]